MQERRTAPRLRTNINARWETLKSQGRGSVCDLSSGGCFVLTGGEVAAKDLVRLELTVDDQIVTAWGYVVYHVVEMGFALRFVLQIEDDRRAIEHLIEHAQRTAV
jgi:PilZ domain-containing protein